MTLAERFWAKVRKSDNCWEWTGGYGSHGYGDFYTGGHPRHKTAPRVSFELAHGPIPKGAVLCHRCDNKRCVRPDHLYLGTPADNMRDCVERQRHAAAKQTACKHGHPFDAENTIVRVRDGRRTRVCRACERIRQDAFQIRVRGDRARAALTRKGAAA